MTVSHPPAEGTELPSHYSGCFACGDVPGGLRVRCRVGPASTVLGTFEVRAEHQGAPGIAHGGLIAVAFDEVLGALAHLTGVPAVTGQLQTEFRRPVPVGSTLHITARVDERAGRKVSVSATAALDALDGPVAARASAVFVTVPMEHFRTHGRPEDVEAARAEWRERRRAATG